LRVKLLAIGGNGAMLLEAGGNRLHLARTVADKILIKM
jgi:hypothetical protein